MNPKIEFTRKGYQYVRLPKSSSGITISPDIQFGQPCIKGTRIPCTSIYSYFKGGDKIEYLVKSFNITPEQVQACIDYVEGK